MKHYLERSEEVTLSPRAIFSFRSFESFRRSDQDRMSRPRVGDRMGDFRRRSDGSVDTELDETTELELVVLDMLEDLGIAV